MYDTEAEKETLFVQTLSIARSVLAALKMVTGRCHRVYFYFLHDDEYRYDIIICLGQKSKDQTADRKMKQCINHRLARCFFNDFFIGAQLGHVFFHSIEDVFSGVVFMIDYNITGRCIQQKIYPSLYDLALFILHGYWPFPVCFVMFITPVDESSKPLSCIYKVCRIN